ncbi:hypothetical protein [Rheinheimera sp.]|uniref:hypothetical protein n=1 Tax=Rheinheimera sp. TaxID=1869214 RepID=UPI004047DEB3
MFGLKSHTRVMRYADNITLTPIAGSTVTHVFSANSMFDPDYSGSGHQFRYWDQYTQYYNHYVVLRSKITAVFSHTGNVSTTSPYMCIVSLRDDYITESNQNNYIENGLCAYRTLPHSPESTVTLTKSFNAKTFFNKRFVQDSETLSSSVSASPTESAYFHCSICPNQSSGDAVISLTITMESQVLFSEPKSVGQS